VKDWLVSLKGALAIAAAAWVSQLWRAWLDMLFEYTGGAFQAELDSAGTLALTLIYTALFAGWAYAMHAAARGSRGGLIATLALNTVVWLAIPVGWLTAYCPADCRAQAGVLFNTSNWLNLIFGLLAALVLGLQLRRRPTG
jgi:hypothetical protein